METCWVKIKEWISKNFPPILDTLNEGATDDDICKLESELGVKLPTDFIEFYKVHNGQSWTHLSLFDSDRLLSTDEIIREWSGWNSVLPEINAICIEMSGKPASSDPEPGIKDYWWNAAWIPITANGSGDNYCIDLDPTPEGTKGQIIRMWHDMPWRELVAPSFKDWILKYVADLENGVYIISEDIGIGGIIKPLQNT